MRGKNIIWISLIALLLSTVTMGIGTAQDTCRIFVDPAAINNLDMSISEFTVDVNVENMVDLYTVGFTLAYEPYGHTLVCIGVAQGDFLEEVDIVTDFVYNIDNFAGEVKIGYTRLGGVPGVPGSGKVASITFQVLEAGSSPLDLIGVELYDSTGGLLTCDIAGSSYNGPEADLRIAYLKGIWWFPFAWADDDATAHSRVCNYGEVPLETRVQYELIRSDGRVTTFGTGQKYRTAAPPDEYLYVNELIPDFPGWTEYGVAPFLDAPDDGNYVEFGAHCTLYGIFGFEDMVLGDRVIENVILEGYTNGPYNEGADYDVYANPYTDFAWLGSLYGTGAPGWVEPRWLDPGECVSTAVPNTLTEAGLNDLTILFHSYYAGAGDFIDCVRLRIEFASVDPLSPVTIEIAPGACMWMNVSTWILSEDDIGFYRGTATCYYNYNGDWIQGDTERRIWLWVWKPWPWW